MLPFTRTAQLLTWAAALLPVAAPGQLLAHEHGVLILASRSFAAGDTLTLGGIKFALGTPLTLLLVGTPGRFALGDVRTDSIGAFSLRLTVPSDAVAGPYRLVAVADDGDEAASIEVSILPVRPAGPALAPAPADPHTVPSAEPLRLARAHNRIVTGGAIGASFLFLLLGLQLVNRRWSV